jgi:hypothetical protein
MQPYGHYEFEELLKDEENLTCFDCSKTPAHWASVNNAIYLCIECSGAHRGYGVNISYIRSVTLDTWNDNQVTIMKNGGNKALRDLLEIYQINRLKVDKSVLYNSRLLDFYRKFLKSKVNKQPYDKAAPAKEEALKSLNADTYSGIPDSSKYSSISTNGVKPGDDKFKSVSSDGDPGESGNDSGFIGQLNSWMGHAYGSTKYIAGKVKDMEIGTKIINTGSVFTNAGGAILDKGTEAAV